MATPIPPRPSVPTPYVAGTVSIPANQPSSLLDLIQQQISRDCPGTSVEFLLWPDPCNQAPIWVGAFMQIPGPLDVTQYAYYLTPMAEPRLYRSSYPGTSTVIGVVQVFSQPPAKLHVEVQE